ncbi:MAG: hypothetical protein H0Z37_11140 [Firmicutes bacterium]|nr:hypothetical protein [Bacillota bacterium]
MASILHPLGVDPEFAQSVLEPETGLDHPAAARMVRRLNELRFPNARVRELGRRIVHQRHVAFWFKLTFRSDEAGEELIAVLVDPLTEESVPLPPLDGAADFTPEQSSGTYAVERLYRQACRHVSMVAEARSGPYQEAARARLARELDRIADYYRGLREEALESVAQQWRRQEAIRNRLRLRRSLTGSLTAPAGEDDSGEDSSAAASAFEARIRRVLDELAADQKRRIEEMRRNYQVRAEATLAGAALLWVPRVELRYKMLGPSRREAVFYYDPLREQCVDLRCEACDRPMREVYLCEAGELICSRCFGPCRACGRPVCRSCAQGECHLCGALLCGRCESRCPLSATALGTLDVCPACRELVCGSCAAMARFLAG